MVVVGTSKAGGRYLKTDYPIEKGLEAGTQSQTGDIEQLEAQMSFLLDTETRGIK